MAGGPKLDGAGIQKMKTLDEALVQLQRIHGMVENYALALKQSKPGMLYGQQAKRALVPLGGLLKAQFGLIADQVAGMVLVAGRGGSEQTKVRMLREGVGSVRQAIEIAITRTKDQHAVKDEATEPKA